MKRSLDTYDRIPEEMENYLSHNGFHFNKKAYDYAAKKMSNDPYTKEQVEELLKRYGITLKNDTLYDKVYVATMAKSDFLGKSIPNEQYLAMFVRDYLDDEDGCGEEAFRRWIADSIGRGEPIDWYELL